MFFMEAQLIAALVIVPFTVVFIYAGIHEYRRYKSEGSATYGLVFDEESGTSYVTGIAEAEDGFNPDDFDPNAYNESKAAEEADAEEVAEADDKAGAGCDTKA
jgi:hypothetical protein